MVIDFWLRYSCQIYINFREAFDYIRNGLSSRGCAYLTVPIFFYNSFFTIISGFMAHQNILTGL